MFARTIHERFMLRAAHRPGRVSRDLLSRVLIVDARAANALRVSLLSPAYRHKRWAKVLRHYRALHPERIHDLGCAVAPMRDQPLGNLLRESHGSKKNHSP